MELPRIPEKFKFFLDSAIAFAGIGALTFFAYLYQFLMVRMLPPADYGELSVLIGIFAILTFPATSVQSLLSTEVLRLERAKEEGKILYFLFHCLELFSKAGIPILLIFFAASALYAPAFPYALMLLGAFLMYLIGLPGAYFQGKENVPVASFIQGFTAFLKALFAVALVFFGFGFLGAVISFPASAAIALAVLAIPFLGKRALKKYDMQFTGRVGLVLASGILFTVFLYLDLFAARIFLGPEQAGVYNVAAITSRILYFLSTGLVLVFMPASAKISGEPPGKKQLYLLGKSILLLLAPLALFILLPSQLISFFYTPALLPAAAPFAILSLGVFLFAIFFLCANMSWAYGNEKAPFIISIFGIIGNSSLLYFFGTSAPSLSNFALATTASSALMAILGLFFLFFKTRPVISSNKP